VSVASFTLRFLFECLRIDLLYCFAMKPAIKIQNIAKSYRISHTAERGGYKTLRESIAAISSSPFRRLKGEPRDKMEEFWALEDISFDVQPGEVVGIIGRNGAGKSTLLKILSRIAKPTSGEVQIRGRIGSLLEVGTGFHPELTGRENIYLNGSILGMSRQEISGQFDNIVQFAEVERFLDTPVKRYSSGMYVRLAFAVAAHLNPEILLVDEVLAVGDIAFQNKCLARMEHVAKEGRTILFVSHNMAAVQSLCSRAILISGGRIQNSGETADVISRFIGGLSANSQDASLSAIELRGHQNRRRGSKEILCTLRINTPSDPGHAVPVGSAVKFAIGFSTSEPIPGAAIAVIVCARDGQRIAIFHSRIHSRVELWKQSSGVAFCDVPELPLLPGTYRIDLAVATNDDAIDYIEQASLLTVVPSDYFGTGELPTTRQGMVALKCSWAILD